MNRLDLDPELERLGERLGREIERRRPAAGPPHKVLVHRMGVAFIQLPERVGVVARGLEQRRIAGRSRRGDCR